ncbi:galactose mutarotase [Sphingomonas sp. RHCKR7]|uniref:aldose epimerase family protein n=1 Tax=Sphingomonas folli TaxID=2862497 RepID=UPI001CA50906|nr:aldose epimerase family protein [Sphingomonas folli]MBW6526429.1 galactose mutarotase [Sphingomonas folli]
MTIAPVPEPLVLASASGVTAAISPFGARLIRIDAPDRTGRVERVLLGYDDPEANRRAALPDGGAYLGATCGRVANRIADAAFALDGVRHRLAANEGAHQRHGGPVGFDRANWTVREASPNHVTMRHHSPDGDQGFPGALDITSSFDLSDDGELSIVYTARTTRPTHVNLVSHGYFNLSGGSGTIADHLLRVDADSFLAIDADQLPQDVRPVRGTPFDFTAARRVGSLLESEDEQARLSRGGNHNFCLKGVGVRPVAWLEHPGSGRTLTLSTDQPGLQLYAAGWLEEVWRPHAALCLEAQAWPNACNRPDFPPTRLDPGERYRSEVRLRFGVAPEGMLG